MPTREPESDERPSAVQASKPVRRLAGHEFTFLDHALKSGDSLVGLTQIYERSALHSPDWQASVPSPSGL
jgi:hypothetical protein